MKKIFITVIFAMIPFIASYAQDVVGKWKLEDGSAIGYRLIRRAKGYNTGPDLVDTENNSFYINISCK